MKLKNSILILTVAVLSACTLNEPSLPGWDTEWTLYLPVENFVMSEAIDDSILFADTTSAGIPVMEFSVSDSTDWERVVAADLAIEGQTEFYEASLGDFDLEDAPVLHTDSIRVEDIIPPEVFALANGDTIPPYPAFTATPPPISAEFDHYHQVQVESGYLWLVFHNEMMLGIDDSMEVRIYNNDETEPLDIILFPVSIPTGTVVESEKIDLSGKTISNIIRIEYSVPIAASDTAQVIDDEFRQSAFYSDLNMDKLKVSWAEAKIPSQDFTQSDSINVEQDDILLKRAVIDRGGIVIRLNNHLPIDAQVTVELPDFRENDQPKIIDRFIEGGVEEVINIDLSGLELINSADPGAYIDFTRYTVHATVDSSDGFVIVSSSDYVSVDMVVDSLYFATVEGELSDMQFDIEPTEMDDLDFFEDLEGGIRLNDLEMTLTFTNEIDFPIDIEFHVVGYHEENGLITASVHIPINETINPSSVSPYTDIILNDQYSTPSIVDLLEILPTRIKVYGQAALNSEGSVSVNQGMRMEYTVSSPLSFEINTAITQESEIDSLTTDDLDEDTQDMLSNDITEAFAQVNLTNGLPVGVEFYLYLAVDSTDMDPDIIADSSRKIVVSGDIKAGEKGLDGYVETPVESSIEVELSHDQLQIFSKVPLYMKQKIILQPTTDPETTNIARFRQTDEIEVDAMIRVKYIMNNQE